MRPESLIFERVVREIGVPGLLRLCLRLTEGAGTRELASEYGLSLGQVRAVDQFLPAVMASCVRQAEAIEGESSCVRSVAC